MIGLVSLIAVWLVCVAITEYHVRQYMKVFNRVAKKHRANRAEFFARYGMTTFSTSGEAQSLDFHAQCRASSNTWTPAPLVNLQEDSIAIGVPVHVLRKLAAVQQRRARANMLAAVILLPSCFVGNVVYALVGGG